MYRNPSFCAPWWHSGKVRDLWTDCWPAECRFIPRLWLSFFKKLSLSWDWLFILTLFDSGYRGSNSLWDRGWFIMRYMFRPLYETKSPRFWDGAFIQGKTEVFQSPWNRDSTHYESDISFSTKQRSYSLQDKGLSHARKISHSLRGRGLTHCKTKFTLMARQKSLIRSQRSYSFQLEHLIH